MLENIQNYKQSDLKFSPSKLYFQHQNQILQKIWFISPMTIDVHFKYSFQEIYDKYFIEGWEFEWYTTDHVVHEQWIIYKIWFSDPKFKKVENLSLDVWKSKNKSVRPLILSILWWCIVFGLLFWLSQKFVIWKVLFWLNIIWWFVLLCFYAWELWNFWYRRVVGMDKIKSWWFNVKYSNQSDADIISSDVIDVLKKLKDEYWVVKFAFTWNCLYLLQDLHDYQWNRLTSSGKMYTEQEKAKLQQKTMNFIHQPEFLSHFMES